MAACYKKLFSQVLYCLLLIFAIPKCHGVSVESLLLPNNNNLEDEISVNVTVGYYNIESVHDGSLMAAIYEGHPQEPAELGPVSAESRDMAAGNETMEQAFVWFVDGELNNFALYKLQTLGPNKFNNIAFELVGDFGTAIEPHWELLEVGDELVQFRIRPFMGPQYRCLINDGQKALLRFTDCDDTDVQQQWRFLPVASGRRNEGI